MAEVISTLSLSKKFGQVQALADMSFALQAGEIRALCGENGAGKSTFVKLLTGLYRPDSGTIRIGGRDVEIAGPRHAEQLGIGIVSQELSLAPHLSILDNIWLGSSETPLLYRSNKLRRRAGEAMATLGLGDWNIDRKVSELSLGEQQMVEIARLLARNAKVMILDEPTATLSDVEIERILSVLRKLKARGHSIIYVSHRLGEIFEVCDTVSVFRNGRHAGTQTVASLDRDGLVGLMLGRSLEDMYPAHMDVRRDGALEMRGLAIPGVLGDISFTAPRGCITCIAGQVGSGATAIARTVAGLVSNAAGEMSLDGQRIAIGSVPRALSNGIQFVSDDRRGEGIFPELTVTDNLVATRLETGARAGFLSWRRLAAIAARLAALATVDRARLRSHAGVLSGGNQQKVLFGRALDRARTGVLVMNEPTRGIDVGARADLYTLMRKFCEAGNAILMTSSDLEEVVGMADRVVTIYRGRIVGLHEDTEIEMHRILTDITHPAAASGGRQ